VDIVAACDLSLDYIDMLLHAFERTHDAAVGLHVNSVFTRVHYNRALMLPGMQNNFNCLANLIAVPDTVPGAALAGGSRGPDPPATARTTCEIRLNPMTFSW